MVRGRARPKLRVPKQQQAYAEERGGAYRPSGAALTIQEVLSLACNPDAPTCPDGARGVWANLLHEIHLVGTSKQSSADCK